MKCAIKNCDQPGSCVIWHSPHEYGMYCTKHTAELVGIDEEIVEYIVAFNERQQETVH